jgi:hypothetical protein
METITFVNAHGSDAMTAFQFLMCKSPSPRNAFSSKIEFRIAQKAYHEPPALLALVLSLTMSNLMICGAIAYSGGLTVVNADRLGQLPAWPHDQLARSRNELRASV